MFAKLFAGGQEEQLVDEFNWQYLQDESQVVQRFVDVFA